MLIDNINLRLFVWSHNYSKPVVSEKQNVIQNTDPQITKGTPPSFLFLSCNESPNLRWHGHAPTHLIVLGTVAEHQTHIVDKVLRALVVMRVLPLQFSLHQVQVHGVFYDLIVVGHLVKRQT